MRCPECSILELKNSESLIWKIMTTLMLMLQQMHQKEDQTIVIENLAQENDKKVLAINWSHQGDNDGEIFPLVKQIIFQKPLPFKQLIRLLGEVL